MMSLTVADLSAKLGLDSTGFDRGISGVLGKMNPIGGAALGASTIATGAVAAIGYAAFKMGEEFDTAYDGIRIGTGATGARLDGLKDTFKDVVTDVPASFGDASAAIAGLNQRLGATGPQLRDLSGQFLELSRITGTAVVDNVRLGTRLFGDWSIKTAGQSDALDQLYRATQKSGIGLSDLMTTIVEFGAPLRNLGFSFSDATAMLAKWEKEGVNTSTVLTGMKFALKVFARAGLEPQEALDRLIPKIRDTTDAQKAMAVGMATFGLRAGPDMVAAIREGRFEYQKFAKAIRDGKDTIHTAAADTKDLAEAWATMASTLKVKAEPALTALFRHVSDFAADPMGWDKSAAVRGMMSATETLTAELPKQWGMAAEKTKFIIADLQKLIAEPGVLGDINAEHTQGQLKNIRDDIVKQLKITVQEANQIMDLMFADWQPAKTAGRRVNQTADQIESRIDVMRAQLHRNLAFGKLDNGPLIAKIKAAEVRLAQMRAKFAQSIAVGSLNTSGWLGPLSDAAQKLQNFRNVAALGIYVPPIILDIIKPSGSGGALGGTFSGPKSGYYTLMHGKETIVAHDNPGLGLADLAKYGIVGGGRIEEHTHVHLPGGTMLAGTAQQMADILAPQMRRTHDVAAARRARGRA